MANPSTAPRIDDPARAIKVLSRLERVIEDLDAIEAEWPDGFDSAWPYFDDPRERMAVACEEMRKDLKAQLGDDFAAEMAKG